MTNTLLSRSVQKSYGTMYYVRSMEKSVKWYRDVLGLTVAFESPDWTEFNINGHSLCLHAARPGEFKPSENGTLIITVKGLKEITKELKTKPVELISEVKEVHPGAHCTDFRDPDGNILSLYENTSGG